MSATIFSYGDHALDSLARRDIDRAWVEQTILTPDEAEPDPTHPDRARAFRAIPERGGRILRVVYVATAIRSVS